MSATDLLLKALKDAWAYETSFQWNEKHWRAVLERAKPDLDEFARRRAAEMQQRATELGAVKRAASGEDMGG